MRVILCAIVGLLIAASAEAGEFHVNSLQYQKTLELLESKGIISNFTNACEKDFDGTYICTAKTDDMIILYRSPKNGDELTNITIGAAAGGIQKAAYFAAMATMSLDDHWVTMGTSVEAASMLVAQEQAIEARMEKTYIHGGFDMSESKFAEQFYLNNAKGDMTMVRVVAK